MYVMRIYTKQKRCVSHSNARDQLQALYIYICRDGANEHFVIARAWWAFCGGMGARVEIGYSGRTHTRSGACRLYRVTTAPGPIHQTRVVRPEFENVASMHAQEVYMLRLRVYCNFFFVCSWLFSEKRIRFEMFGTHK